MTPGQPQPQQAPQAQYPPDHQAGMQVPKGGSSCASCKYLGPDQASCTNDYFVQWNGGPQLPAPPDEYCSDWYEPAEQPGQPQQQAAPPPGTFFGE